MSAAQKMSDMKQFFTQTYMKAGMPRNEAEILADGVLKYSSDMFDITKDFIDLFEPPNPIPIISTIMINTAGLMALDADRRAKQKGLNINHYQQMLESLKAQIDAALNNAEQTRKLFLKENDNE